MGASLEFLVKTFCAKEEGKEELNAGQAREVFHAIKMLAIANEEFKKELIEYLEI
jgi:hypothetical protein